MGYIVTAMTGNLCTLVVVLTIIFPSYKNNAVKIFCLIPLIIFTFTFKAQAQENGKQVDLVVKTEVFCDHCNYCESCKPKLETALFDTPGVKKAKLDIETQTIHVVFNPKKITSEQIKKVILSTGYAADGVQPNAEDYAKLDGCCKRK